MGNSRSIKLLAVGLFAVLLLGADVEAEEVNLEVDVVRARSAPKASMDRRIPKRLATILRKERSYNSFTLLKRSRKSARVGKGDNFQVSGYIYLEVEPVTKRTARRPRTTLKTSLYRKVKSGRKQISRVSVSVPKDKPFLQTLEQKEGTLFMAVFAE